MIANPRDHSVTRRVFSRFSNDSAPARPPLEERHRAKTTTSGVCPPPWRFLRCVAVAVALLLTLAVGAFAGAITVHGRTSLPGGVLGPQAAAILHFIGAAPFMFLADGSGAAGSTLWKLDATTNAMLGALTLSIAGVIGNSLVFFSPFISRNRHLSIGIDLLC
jgi:hypothetical protein